LQSHQNTALVSAWRKLAKKQILTAGLTYSSRGEQAAKRVLEYFENALIGFDFKPQEPSAQRP
jgi:hypothetical protein